MNVVLDERQETVRAVVSGEVDADNSDSFHESLSSISPSCSTVQLDLAGVTFFDSSAVSELLRFRQARLSPQFKIEVVAVSAAVQRVFEITGLTEVFSISNDR